MEHCDISKSQLTSLRLVCSANLNQMSNITFILEAQHIHTLQTVANISSETPTFIIENLQPGQEYILTIYSVNLAGIGQKISIKGKTKENAVFQRYPELGEDYLEKIENDYTKIILIVLGISGGATVLFIFLIVIVFCLKNLQSKEVINKKKPSLIKLVPDFKGN